MHSESIAKLSWGQRIAFGLPLPVSVVVGLVVALVAGVGYIYFFTTHPGRGASAIECVQLYRQAHTASDTARIDSTAPFRENTKGYADTCGAMRLRGDLAR